MSHADDRDPPSVRTGRFEVPHRDGQRVEVGEPIQVGGDHPWLCAVKLLGKQEAGDGEWTQTLFMRSARGDSPEEARRNALAQLAVVVGSPVGPPPSTRIGSVSDAPASVPAAPPPRAPFPSPAAEEGSRRASDPPSSIRTKPGILEKLFGKKLSGG